MKKQILILTCLIAFATAFYSQENNWRSSMFKENANYYEIVENNKDRISQLELNTDAKSKKEVKQFNRWENFWKDRVLPDGSFVPASHTFNEWRQDKINQAQNGQAKAINPPWTSLGPNTPPVSSISYYPGMGRINTVAVDPTDANTMYIGTPGGGVWKTTDGGSSWAVKGDDDFPNLGVAHIVIDPTNTSTLYMASGDPDGAQNRSMGVFKSTNGGDSWSLTGLTYTVLDDGMTNKLLIDPNNTNTLLVTTRDNIKRSTDAGATWTNVQTESGAIFNDIMYKSGSASTIYANSKYGDFYVSTDNGVSWTLASTPASDRFDIAVTSDDSNLILSVDVNGEVKKSTNEGSTWTSVSTIPSYSSQGGYNITIAISPLNKDLVLVGGIDGWRSTNGGTSWEKYLDGYWEAGSPYFYVHSDHHDMMFLPGTNTAISVNDGGIHKGDASSGTAWADLSSGLAITQYYNVSGTPQSADKLIAGAQDNDIAVYNGTTFSGQNPGSDGVEGLYDYTNSDIAWSASQNGGLIRTMNGYSTTEDLTTPGGAPFVWKMEIHPINPTTIYGGFSDIYKSTNRGDSWSNLSSGAGTISCISIAPSNADVIYAAGQNGFKKTTNGGTSWSNINDPQASSTIKGIAINATNPDEVFICYAGYSASGKVYKSTDGGANWNNITGSLPNVPAHDIDYKTGTTDGELFLANDLGVYYWSTTDGDWSKMDNDMPNVIVHDLEIHYGTQKLRAATYGRGIWEASIGTPPDNVEGVDFPENAVSIFPNPSVDKQFNIDLTDLLGQSEVLIYNTIGGVAKHFNTSSSVNYVDLSGFSDGIYLITITNNDKKITKKLTLK